MTLENSYRCYSGIGTRIYIEMDDTAYEFVLMAISKEDLLKISNRIVETLDERKNAGTVSEDKFKPIVIVSEQLLK